MSNNNFSIMKLIIPCLSLIFLSVQCFAQEAKSNRTLKSDSSWNAFMYKHSPIGNHYYYDYLLPLNNRPLKLSDIKSEEEIIKQNLDDYLQFFYRESQKNNLGLLGDILGLSKYIAAFTLLIIHLIKYKHFY